MKPLRHFLTAGMLTLGSALAGSGADITHTIHGLAITNYTGYVISADAGTGNSAYNREYLLVQSRVQTANTSGNALLAVEHHLRFRLLNSTGQPHPLYDSTGVVSANATYNLTNVFGISANTTVNRTNVAALRPAARLNPYDQYTVELSVHVPGGLRAADSLTNSPQTFYHFTNVVSSDPGLNVIATVNDASFTRAYAVQTDPDRNSFQAEVDYTLRRYDNFSGANAPMDSVPVTLSYELVNATTGVSVPLASSSTNFSLLLFKHQVPALGPIAPWVLSGTRTVNVRPASGVQLDSVDRNYRLVVTISHLEQNGVPASEQAGNSESSSNTKLLHFNGNLVFGAINTTFSSIDNDPAVESVDAGSHVASTLSVDNQSGVIPGLPGVTYGDGTDLAVRLLSNGDAVTDESVPLVVPPGGIVEVDNVQMQLVPPASLTPGGLLSGLRVYLPTGIGYRTDTVGRILHRSFVVNNVPLGLNLRPVNDVTYAPSTTLQIAEETKPLWIGTSSIVWRVDEGRFEFNIAAVGAQHVRTVQYTGLEAVHASLDNSQRSLKRSNDRFYHAVQSVASPVVAEADNNGVGRISMDLTLGSDDYQTHFPYGANIQWNGGGALQIVQDQVVSTNSQLNDVGMVALSYGTGCTGIDCGDGLNVRTMRLQPTNGVLQFTPDGGLVAGGTLEQPHRLQWGSIEPLNAFAHESFTFNHANFHMPGHFLRGDQTALSIVHRAPAILYTGVAATNTAYLERPDSPDTLNESLYQLGHADYAGMNVAVGSDGDRQGHSTLAGTPTGNYDLKGISKYYARRGGVSGIHDAVFNSFPPTLTLYGYRFDFTNFGLNCLDNRMRDSRIDGLIDIPFPSQFIQEFAGLQINCLGGVEGAPMLHPSNGKALAYWNGSFDALALQFRRDPESLCNVTNAFLTLGARTQIAHVSETLYGTLGFQPDGNLLPRAVGPEDIDSRLKLPNVIHIAGPREEAYVLNPVLDVYFNGYDQLGTETNGAGWVNIAASLDVPFFEDLKVHVQTSATGGNSNAPIYMLGGWPTRGWEFGGKNYFTAEYFDELNRGFANSVTSLSDYRDSQSDMFHPRAQRTWLKIIEFDYPLNWSSITRDFRSQSPIVRDLLVLSTENELKYLSAANAEIAFGAQFDGLPQFNLANIAFQAIDAATAAGNGVVADLLVDAVGGFGRLDEILAADLDPFFNGIFDEKLQPKIDEFYDRLGEAYEVAGPAGWFEEVGDRIALSFEDDEDSILNSLKQLPGVSPGDAGMMKRLTNYLAEAESAVTNIQMILHENPQGNRMIASQLMRVLVDNVALQFAGSFLDELVQPIIAEADPTLDQINEVLANLATALAQIRTNIADPVGGMGTELQNLFAAHELEIEGSVSAMIAGIGNSLQEIDLELDNPITDYSPDEIKQMIRSEVEDRFYGTPLAAAVQVVHRQRLYDVDAAIRQATDTVFQQLNNVIRDVISETAEELNSAFTKLIDPLDNVAAAAKINGYAHINGDSLKEARVDLHTRLEIGTALEFNGYLQVKELDSQGSAGCAYAGSGTTTEVTLGAEDVQVGWISPDLRASIGTKFSFDDDGVGLPLRGLGGSFELTGKLDYEAFAINFLGAAIALGQDEYYLSGAAGMRVNKYDVFGGIYFGRSCTLEPIELWDPEVAGLLGTSSFSGIYAYGEGWIPINELIGIPASCLFNISAGLGMGAGVFFEGPTFVAKMTAGVSGEALCMVGIKGEVTGTGVLEGVDLNVLDGLTVKAKGTVGGKFGPCPFCLELEQSIALTFKQGKWKLDF